jgi:Domain of unknown function (DUF6265)
VKRIGFSGLRVAAGGLLGCSLMFAGAVRAQQAAGSGTQAGATSATAASAGNSTSAAPSAASGHSSTGSSASSSTQQQVHGAADHAPALSDFAWLEGRWRGEWGSRVAEQTWLGPKAGEMTGVFRLVEGDKVLVLELFSLTEKPEGISFYFRHFTPELLPWEKSDATVLKLETLDPKKAVFVNPVNGEPKRTSMVRVDADTYTARSEIEPEHGEPQGIEITFRRQKPAVAAPSGGSGAHRKKP